MAISSHTKWLRILNIMFSVVILVLAGSAYSRICSPPNHINQILDNWKRLSIYNIASVGGLENCDFGYEEISFSTLWPGTESGCYCKSGAQLYTGSCSSSQVSSGCSNVAKTKPFYMNSWRGRKLCVLRAGTSVYYSPNPKSGVCSNKTDSHGNTVEFIVCGKGNVATCQEKSLGCPVNRLQLVKSSEPKPSDLESFVFLGESYVLYFGYGNANSTQAPVIDFAISEGKRCLQDPGDEGTSGKQYYSLLQSTPTGCKYTDGRFLEIDSLDEESFYSNNDQQNISSLPGMTFSKEAKYYLSYRTSVLWKSVCHNDYYSKSTLHDNKDPYKYIEALHFLILAIEVIFSVYFVLIDPLLLYFCYKRAEEEINEFDQPIYSIMIFEKILKIILVPVLLVCCIVVAYYRNWFANLEDRCCSDPTTNACFGFVDYILDDLYTLDWVNFSVVVIVLIIDMISSLCLFVARTKDNLRLN